MWSLKKDDQKHRNLVLKRYESVGLTNYYEYLANSMEVSPLKITTLTQLLQNFQNFMEPKRSLPRS
jgi:hypothetical protein